MRGTVVKWIERSGFGFIKPNDVVQNDVYFHASSINGIGRVYGSVYVGCPVQFDVGKDATHSDRPMAINVKLLPRQVTA